MISAALYVLADLRIPDHLASGPLTAEELARLTGSRADTLYRVLRTTASYGLFVEDAESRFALTDLGSVLRSDAPGHMRSLVMYLAGPIVRRAFGELGAAVRTGEEPMKQAYGLTFFDYITDKPDETRFFNEAMIAIHGTEPQAVAAAYDFAGIDTLVDVGGGTGNLLTTLLLANPHLRGVLYDRPGVTADARRRIEASGLTARCEVREGSFFDAVPGGGDAYLLSHILHDWDDATCLGILASCRKSMHERARLLVLEQLIVPGNARHPAKFNDLVMLAVMSCGRERTEREYAELCAKAGFTLTRVVPTETPSSIIEAI